jgi:indoleamine 2,3-dioxygenase
MLQSPIIRLEDYAVSDKNGFLPTSPPLAKLPAYYEPWEALAGRLSTLINEGSIRSLIDDLPILDAFWLKTEPEKRRAYSVLGFLTHAYIWGGEKPKDVCPRVTVRFLQDLITCDTYRQFLLVSQSLSSKSANISDSHPVQHMQGSLCGTTRRQRGQIYPILTIYLS